ncbi:hypothetical protein [Pelagicoccus albus]|uniref:Mannitol repressor n=1 Tax=Pelagicoccus albus TaxID=415222 RepID=A0A7X1B565_9BACT|nr:hypothetical protein [Pelagicoccus albus]MBC2605747.1 hypothetical protein [Pelagicoccus albus]
MTANQEFVDLVYNEVGSELKQHGDFLIKLLEEDDWSFVIKSHALIEASVTNLLIRRIGEPEMTKFVKRMPLSDSESGKVVLLKDLGLLDSGLRSFIRWYSELRNKLVHNLEHIDFQLESHFASLDPNQKKSWKKKVNDIIEIPETLEKIFYSNWKIPLTLCLNKIIGECSFKGGRCEAIRKIQNMRD